MKLRPAARTRNLISYEPGKPTEELERELGISEAIKLASNENPLGPSPKALGALREALSGLHRYPDGGGFYLKIALSERLGPSPDHFTLGNGTNEVLENIAKTFLEPGDEVIVGKQGFVVFHIVAELCEARRVVVPFRDFAYDLPEMARRVTDRTQMVFLDNPNNPTGTAVGQEALETFLEQIPPHVVVVLDEAYCHYATRPDYPNGLTYLETYPHLFVVRTFSKAYGLAGLRVGFGVGHPEAIRAVEKVREPFNVSSLAQVAARAALFDEAHVTGSNEMNAKGLAYLYGELETLGLSCVPSQANFLLVEVGDGANIYEKLLREGVIVRPMGGYGLPAHIRLTVGLPEENKRFVQALRRVIGN